MSLYKLPNVRATLADWNNTFSQFESRITFCNDLIFIILNEELPKTVQVEILIDAVGKFDLIYYNDGTTTRVALPGGNVLPIDPTILFPSFADYVSWDNLDDTSG